MELDLDKYATGNRFLHRYILGQTGTGKSTLLLNFAIRDVLSGHGVCFFDFHGDDSETLLSHIPEEKAGEVVFFDPVNRNTPFNGLADIHEKDRARVASAYLDTFKSIWEYDSATPRIDINVRNGVAALLDNPMATFLGLHFIFLEKNYRKRLLKNISDPIVKDYWSRFDLLSSKEIREFVGSTINKTGFMMSEPRIRHAFGCSQPSFTISEILAGKILIVRLPQGQLGLHTAKLMASVLLTALHSTALTRKERIPFHIYLDEVQNFGSRTLCEMLSGIRKFGVSLTLAHQYMNQLDRPLHNAIIGNVGTRIIFRIGEEDTQALRFTEFGVKGHNISLSEMPNQLVRVSMPPERLQEFSTPSLPKPQPPQAKERILKLNHEHRTKSDERIDAEVAQFIKSLT